MKTKKIAGIAILSVVLIIGIYFGVKALIYAKGHESTDNAQIDGDISPIIPRVDGYIASISVDDNSHVEKGDVLATIDTADLNLKVREQDAALSGAKVDFEDAKANLSYTRSLAEQADIDIRDKSDDLKRQEGLMQDGATTQQALDHAQIASDNSRSKKQSLLKQIKVASVKLDQAQVDIEKAEVSLSNAQLQLSYATLKAPISGTVSELDIEVGQLVARGQTIMAVVDKTDIYVTANFKEGQIGQICEGQIVAIEVDAYPDKTFEGKVQSINGATGSKFSLLPADNASGNFVKVEQRIPVKIVFTGDTKGLEYLKPGMNVIPAIEIPKEQRDGRGE